LSERMGAKDRGRKYRCEAEFVGVKDGEVKGGWLGERLIEQKTEEENADGRERMNGNLGRKEEGRTDGRKYG